MSIGKLAFDNDNSQVDSMIVLVDEHLLRTEKLIVYQIEDF